MGYIFRDGFGQDRYQSCPHPLATADGTAGLVKNRFKPNNHLRDFTSHMRLMTGLRGVFAGSGPVMAEHQAYAVIYGIVQREATMVALSRIFQYLGLLVLVLIPLIALTKRPPKDQDSVPMAH